MCVDGTLNLSWCLNGYHTEDYSTCVSNTKQEQCIQSWAPDHAHYKSQLVNVTWNGWWDYGSWTQPSICGWECDSDYHLSSDGKKCEFNHKTVQCQTWTKPENSEYIITTDWIEWNAQPSVCGYECNTWYVMSWAMWASWTVCVPGTSYTCIFKWTTPFSTSNATLLESSDKDLTEDTPYALYSNKDAAKWHKCAFYCDEWYAPYNNRWMTECRVEWYGSCKWTLPNHASLNNGWAPIYGGPYDYEYNPASWDPCAFSCDEWYTWNGSSCLTQTTYSCVWTYPTWNYVVVSNVLPTSTGTEYYYDSNGTGWACSFTCGDRSNDWCSFYYADFHKTWSWDWEWGCSYRCSDDYHSCIWPEKVNQSHIIMNNYDMPDENMNYYYSTNTSNVCTFSCESWYVYTWTTLSWACILWLVEPEVEYKCTWSIPDDFHATLLKWSDQWLTQDTNKKFYKDPSGKKCAYYCDESKWYWFGSEDIWCIWQDSKVDVTCGWSIPDHAHDTSISDYDRNAWFYWNWLVYSKAEFKHSDKSWYCTFQCDDWYKWSSTWWCLENVPEVKSHEVTYNYSANGWSSASPLKAQVKEGSDAIAWATAIKAWWTFVWWNTDSGATSALNSYVMPVSWGNVTLYAIFKKIHFVTFRNNLNPFSTSIVHCYAYNNQTSCDIVSPNIVAPSGFTSIWWSTSRDNHVSEWSEWSSRSISSNGDYYAQTQKVMNVSYDKNGANSVWHTSYSCTVYNGGTNCFASKKAPSITVWDW